MYIVTVDFVCWRNGIAGTALKTNSTDLLRKINYERKNNGL